MTSHFPYSNPFNILASLIAQLKMVNPCLYQSKDFRGTSEDEHDWDDEADKLFQAYPALQDSDILLRDGVPPEAVDAIQAWRKAHNSFFPILSLACRLDRALYWESILRSSYLCVHLKNSFQSLNDNAAEEGIFLAPRVPSLNDPFDQSSSKDAASKTWAFDWKGGINQELGNTYYMEADQMLVAHKAYTVVHIIVNGRPIGKALRIAASPISQGKLLLPPTTYTTPDKRRCFSIDGLQDPDRIQNRFRAAFLCAARHRADIVLFPEMLGDGSVLGSEEARNAFFAQLQEEAEDQGFPCPSLLLMPTWWHDKRNELYVLNAFGECVCVQQKQYPFVYPEGGQDYLEDLSQASPIVYVLHIPKLGRITLPICKDYLTPDYRRFLVEVLRSTFLLCPSYSSGKFSFALTAPAQLPYGCYTAWINPCAAVPPEPKKDQSSQQKTAVKCVDASHDPEKTPPSYVGLIAGPTSPEQRQYRLFQPSCKGQCGPDDGPCLFVAEIRRTGAAPEIFLKDHLWPGSTPTSEQKDWRAEI